MCSSPLLSIIIPCYNGQKYLGECLDSVLLQDMEASDYEVIIVDDGSTDKTPEIANDYCAKYSNFRYLFIENSGVSIARNTGIDIAKGQYIVFLDSDDKWLPGTMKRNLDRVFERDTQITAFGMYMGNGNADIECSYRVIPWEGNIGKDFFKYGYDKVNVCSMIYSHELLDKYNIRFKEKCKFCEDKFFVDMALYCADRVLFIDEPFFIYRQNENSVMHTIDKTGYKRLVNAYYDRLWEAETIVKMRSYGEENDAHTKELLQSLAVGALLELLQAYFRYSINVSKIVNELKNLGLYENITNYSEFKLCKAVSDEFEFFLRSPFKFAVKYRTKWIAREILVKVLPQFVIERIRYRG